MTKYHAVATVVDGIRFHSKREAHRYGELKLLLKAGEIEDLTLQPVFVLSVQSVPSTHEQFLRARMVTIGEYRADFAYLDHRNGRVVEDSKGVRTPLYKWKKRHVEAQYGITVLET